MFSANHFSPLATNRFRSTVVRGFATVLFVGLVFLFVIVLSLGTNPILPRIKTKLNEMTNYVSLCARLPIRKGKPKGKNQPFLEEKKQWIT